MKGEYISIETARIMADIEKENKMLIEALEINHKIIDKYEEKINKAIEYIKDTRDITDEEYDEGIVLDYNIIKNDLLNILQGDNNV